MYRLDLEIVKSIYQVYQQSQAVKIDNRRLNRGDLFFAIGRKNSLGVHRGANFAEQAVADGAGAVIINDPILKEKHKEDKRYILVEDAEWALQDVAHYHRKQLEHIKILAIAGSNGKTTTRELLQAMLYKQYKCYATKGNLNNHLGVPLSILELTDEYDFALLELGANHLGETAFLTQLLCPDYGLVTNCGKDHLGEYGSVENIIQANKELYDGLEKQGGLSFVNNFDEDLVEMMQSMQQVYPLNKNSSLELVIIERPFLKLKIGLEGDRVVAQSQLFGAFWHAALLYAVAIADYFSISLKDIKEAIENYHPDSLRSQQVSWQSNSVLLDCYNANPSSMQVFLEEIQTIEEDAVILVLGEMLELGAYSEEEHQILLERIDVAHFEQVLLTGEAFSQINWKKASNVQWFATTAELKTYVQEANFKSKRIYVKGSRSNRLEQIID